MGVGVGGLASRRAGQARPTDRQVDRSHASAPAVGSVPGAAPCQRARARPRPAAGQRLVFGAEWSPRLTPTPARFRASYGPKAELVSIDLRQGRAWSFRSRNTYRAPSGPRHHPLHDAIGCRERGGGPRELHRRGRRSRGDGEHHPSAHALAGRQPGKVAAQLRQRRKWPAELSRAGPDAHGRR